MRMTYILLEIHEFKKHALESCLKQNKTKKVRRSNITPTSPSEGILLHSESLIEQLFLFIGSAFTAEKLK